MSNSISAGHKQDLPDLGHIVRQSRRVVLLSKSAERFGMSLSTIWEKSRRDPEFPRAFKLSPRKTCFFEDEINDYLERCAAKSRAVEGIQE